MTVQAAIKAAAIRRVVHGQLEFVQHTAASTLQRAIKAAATRDQLVLRVCL